MLLVLNLLIRKKLISNRVDVINSVIPIYLLFKIKASIFSLKQNPNITAGMVAIINLKISCLLKTSLN